MWKRVVASLLSVSALGLVLAYLKDRPSIEYVSLTLGQPLRPNSLILIQGRLKNFGSTTASDFRVETMIDSGPADKKAPKPNFDNRTDQFGQTNSPAIHDLPSGAEESFASAVTGVRRWAISEGAYNDLVAGKQKVLFYTRVQYNDLLDIPHTKVFCHKLDPSLQNSLARCTVEDSPF